MTPDQEQQIMRAEELIRVIEERVGLAQVPVSQFSPLMHELFLI